MRCVGVIVACGLFAVAIGCGGGGGGGGGGQVVVGTVVVGKVVNAATGDPVKGANVTAGNQTKATGADGTFRLTNVPVNTQEIQVSDPGNRFYVFAATIQRNGTTTAVDPRNVPVNLVANQDNDVGIIGLYDISGPPPPPIF